MKLLLTWSAALAVAVVLGLLLRYNEGIVTVTLPPYRYDIAANTAALVIIGGFIALYLLTRTGLNLFRMPRSIRHWQDSRQTRLANASLTDSVVALNEGRLDKFESLARRALEHAGTAGTAALLAARAAHAVGDVERRDRWLARLDKHPGLGDARAMFVAEIGLEQGQGETALAALDSLSPRGGASVQAQRLRIRALELAQRWPELLEATARLRKARGLDDAGARSIRVRAYEEMFEEAVVDLKRVEQLFKSLSREDRDDPAILVSAIEAFADAGDERRAVKMIDKLLAVRIEPRLLILFTRMKTVPPSDRLRMAEGWAARHPDNAFILATVGRLCLAEGLWDKAEVFLKRANELEPSPFTRLALAEMYEILGRSPEASEMYRLVARDQTGLLAPPEGEHAASSSKPIAAIAGPAEADAGRAKDAVAASGGTAAI